MSRGVTRFLLGLALFAWFSYKLFPNSFDFLFYDTCSVEYAQARADELLTDDKRQSYKEKQAFEEMEKAFSKFNLSPQQEFEAKRNSLIYAWFVKNKHCPMPEEVENAFFEWDKSADTNDSGTQNCSADFFLEEGKAFLSKVKEKPEEYSKLQKKGYDMLTRSVEGDRKALEFINQRWQDEKVRENLILAYLQRVKREEAQCTEPDLPVKAFFKDFVNEAILNSK